jgi:hypothetical protein
MHYITEVEYESGYRLRLRFEDGSFRGADLTDHLDGDVFEPLRDVNLFRTARLNTDIDTVVWDNGADMSPDFLYDIGQPLDDATALKVVEERVPYDGERGSAGQTPIGPEEP